MGDVLVLGAGIAGVSAAIQLRKRGFNVVLADHAAPGSGVSFGNAGLIHAEGFRPQAMPLDPRKLWSMLSGHSNELAYKLLDVHLYALPILRYLWNSSPARYAHIVSAYATLMARAEDEHLPFIREAQAGNLLRQGGFYQIYRKPNELEEALRQAEVLAKEFDAPHIGMDAAQLMEAEPNIRGYHGAGAIHWRKSWSVSDPAGLVAAYAGLFVRLGGQIVRADANTLEQVDGGHWRVQTGDGMLEAQDAVVCLGPWSPGVLKRFGYHVTMLEKRGYHMHYRSDRPVKLPVMDADYGYVIAPMERGLRITTGVELARNNGNGEPEQLKRAYRAASSIISMGAPVEAEAWSGIRPFMPDMLPVVGPAPKHKGLWFHFGHGHHGLTLGPVTARLLAEIMSGAQPFTDPAPFSPARFGAGGRKQAA